MLYYEKKGQGPPVVLLHGLPCNHTIWENLTGKLSRRYSFILPDFPGAGNSPENENDVVLKDVATAIAGILDKENISKVIFAGHSMGGYTAMSFAKYFPQRTKAVSLIHSSAAADTDEKKQVRRKSINLIEKGEDAKTAFVKALMRKLFDPDFVNNQPDIFQHSVDTGNQLSSRTLVQFYKALLHREDTTDLLPGLPHPIQWILGENDDATNLEATLPLCHLAPVNDVCVYPSCGHMSMLEAPEKLAEDLNRFWSFVYAL